MTLSGQGSPSQNVSGRECRRPGEGHEKPQGGHLAEFETLKGPEGRKTGKDLQSLLSQVPALVSWSAISQWIPSQSASHARLSAQQSQVGEPRTMLLTPNLAHSAALGLI